MSIPRSLNRDIYHGHLLIVVTISGVKTPPNWPRGTTNYSKYSQSCSLRQRIHLSWPLDVMISDNLSNRSRRLDRTTQDWLKLIGQDRCKGWVPRQGLWNWWDIVIQMWGMRLCRQCSCWCRVNFYESWVDIHLDASIGELIWSPGSMATKLSWTIFNPPCYAAITVHFGRLEPVKL